MIGIEFLLTYALTVTSNSIAAIGIMNNPSQKTGDENNNLSMPANTAAIGIDGQKLLKKKYLKKCKMNIIQMLS